MDYLSLLQPTPEQQQTMLAEQLRRRQEQATAMRQANDQANRYNTLAAVTQMANNQSAAQAAQLAMKNAQLQHRPINLGAQGFALPSNGQFVSSPMYEDEKNAAREQQRLMLAAQLQQRDSVAAERADNERARIEVQREAANQRYMLGQTLAEIRREQASRPRPLSAAEQKRLNAEEKAVEGKESLSSTLDTLAGYYQQLQKSGGIQDTKKGVLSNTLARLQSSGVGQALGGAAGTEEQSLRNNIIGMRNLLLMDIKNATGMSASQMNSNVELQTYLAAATDPTKDVQSNMRALTFLDQKYGMGRLSQSLGISPEAPGRQAPAERQPRGVPTAEQLGLPPGFRVVGAAP